MAIFPSLSQQAKQKYNTQLVSRKHKHCNCANHWVISNHWWKKWSWLVISGHLITMITIVTKTSYCSISRVTALKHTDKLNTASRSTLIVIFPFTLIL